MLRMNYNIVIVRMIIRMLSFVNMWSITLLWRIRKLLNMVQTWLANKAVLIIGNLLLVVLVVLPPVLAILSARFVQVLISIVKIKALVILLFIMVGRHSSGLEAHRGV